MFKFESHVSHATLPEANHITRKKAIRMKDVRTKCQRDEARDTLVAN
jgi:hypothetical protein